MDDKEILSFIKELDAHVPKEKAEAEFAAFGEVALYANKEGYLRMALELMKCAFDETYNDADLNYVFNKNSEFGIEHFARTKEELEFFSS